MQKLWYARSLVKFNFPQLEVLFKPLLICHNCNLHLWSLKWNIRAPVFPVLGVCFSFLEELQEKHPLGKRVIGTPPSHLKRRLQQFLQPGDQAPACCEEVCGMWDKRTASFPQLSPPIEAAALLSISPAPFWSSELKGSGQAGSS